MILLFFDISGGEIFIIIIMVLIIFGPKRIPEIARKAGKAMSEVRKASNTIKNEIMSESDNIRESFEKETKEIKGEIKDATSIDSKPDEAKGRNNN